MLEKICDNFDGVDMGIEKIEPWEFNHELVKCSFCNSCKICEYEQKIIIGDGTSHSDYICPAGIDKHINIKYDKLDGNNKTQRIEVDDVQTVLTM